jgi:hypothetical protein
MHQIINSEPPRKQIVAFDYSAIDSDTAALAQAAANTIRTKHGNVVQNAIEAGRELLKVRERLDGHFLSWVKAEFQWSDHTAENYMLAAREFGSRIETVSNLPLRIVYSLASKSTPAPVRQEILQRIERGEAPTPKEIDKQISELRERARMAREEAGWSEAKRKYTTKQRKQFKEAQQRRREKAAQEMAQADAIAANLIKEIGLAGITRIIRAMDDNHYVHDALRKRVNEAASDDLELPACLDRRGQS